MGVIIGSEALAAGMVTRNDLRRRYTRMFPDVYGPPEPTIRERARGAWLWSGRRGVIAGVAASALHWAKYVDDDVPIELLWQNGRPPSGLIVRNEIYAADEVTTYDGIPLTTPARTIFDLGRHLNRDAAVARIDALLWLGRVGVPDVEPIAARYPWARGVEKLRVALELADDGAESPRESRLRLLLTDAGMRPTDTQIPVYEGNRLITKFDMGWKQLRIGVQYEGKHHQTDRGQYVYDLQVLPKLEARNWIVVKVIKEDTDNDILARVAAALYRRGWRAA
ncbi:hypothetical protein [Mycolicibacterium mucogenicum]|uniref:AbiEi antitoxin C-terminal domain-containing protein n=1 Tax=Mycolicibacterium mucogenicum TaxID=56689 RepID=A0A4R5WRQ1_MYCMU|nr:hypothetical protein [Mycolicibacterium mucogenicum]TDK93704.1 hypothetical protein EUA03_00940 [Mycolicibacterium mucogenicum]